MTEPAPSQGTSWIHSIYKCIIALDVKSTGTPSDWLNVGDIIPNYTLEVNGVEGNVMLAIPSTKVAIAVESNSPGPFNEDGWAVINLSSSHMAIFDTVFKSLATLVYEHERRKSMEAVKATSRHEQWLIDRCISRGIPTPDRNHSIKREDGKKELTTPDLCWPHLMLAFFVDGVYWHQIKDDKERLKRLRDNTDLSDIMLDSNRSKMSKDSSIRSEMASNGWTILTCTDEDLEQDGGVDRQVEIIRRTIVRIQNDKKVLSDTAVEHSVSDDLL